MCVSVCVFLCLCVCLCVCLSVCVAGVAGVVSRLGAIWMGELRWVPLLGREFDRGTRIGTEPLILPRDLQRERDSKTQRWASDGLGLSVLPPLGYGFGVGMDGWMGNIDRFFCLGFGTCAYFQNFSELCCCQRRHQTDAPVPGNLNLNR